MPECSFGTDVSPVLTMNFGPHAHTIPLMHRELQADPAAADIVGNLQLQGTSTTRRPHL